MTKRRGPRMGPIGPSKPSTADDEQMQVETAKIDPEQLLGGSMSAAETERELEPMNFRAAPVREAVERKAQEKAAEQLKDQFLPPEDKSEPLEEHVPIDMITRLEEKFGMKPERLYDVTLEAAGVDLEVSMRLPLYDDFVWAIASIEQKIRGSEDTTLLQTETQREKMLQHLSACRCVAKIEGEWVWDIFKLRDAIEKMNPNWTGENMIGVPDYFQGVLAKQVYDLFRLRLHPDLLFDINNRTEELMERYGPKQERAQDEKDKTDEDPTEAA